MISFCRLPVGSYFRFCGGTAWYKKVSGPFRYGGKSYRGAYVQIAATGQRRYFPTQGCPCVVTSSRELAHAAAKRRRVLELRKLRRERRAA